VNIAGGIWISSPGQVCRFQNGKLNHIHLATLTLLIFYPGKWNKPKKNV